LIGGVQRAETNTPSRSAPGTAVVEEAAALDGVGDIAAHIKAAVAEPAASLQKSEADDERQRKNARTASDRLARAMEERAAPDAPVAVAMSIDW
jgi:hypothetical protein